MWLVILVTCVSASCTNVGKALQARQVPDFSVALCCETAVVQVCCQAHCCKAIRRHTVLHKKKGTQKLPRLILDRGVLKQYIQDSTWTTGLAADVGGGLMMIFVVTRAPISVIQPISSSGLAVLAVFSHYYLHEHMSPSEWAAVALSGLGIVIMGITAAEQAPTTSVSVPGTVLLLSALGALSAYLWWSRRKRQQSQRGSHPAHLGTAAHSGRLEEVAAGAQAGCFYSLSATSCRIGFLLSVQNILYAPLGIGLSFALTCLGLICQTKGLKDGSAMVVCTVAAVASAVTGLLAGVLVLGEKLPSPGPRLWWYLFSWVCVLGGVTGLSGALKQQQKGSGSGRAGYGVIAGPGALTGVPALAMGGKGAEWSGGLHHLPRSGVALVSAGGKAGAILPV